MSKNKTRVAVIPGAGKKDAKAKVSTGQASVGVDFGTTKICIAAYKPDINVFDIIVNEDGERATPTIASFTSSERILGTPAKTAVARNIENTVHSFRNALNVAFEDLPDSHKSYGVSVRPTDDGKAAYEVQFKAETTVVTPDDLVTAFFEKVKALGDGYWDEDVKNIVFSVPLGFDAKARAAMVACAEKAGFSVAAVLAEPLAAAVSFGLDDDTAVDAATKKNVLVVDVGAHSTTFSLLSSQHGLLTLLDSDSTADVGATHIDDKLYGHFARVFQTRFDLDLSDSRRAVARLKQACETVKKTLSVMPGASIKVDSLYEGQDLFADITRARMEMLCDTIFRSLHDALAAFFKRDHGVRTSAVTHIILAGGGAALPRVEQIINSFFAEAAATPVVLKQPHPSEAAVFGCAKQASLLASVSAEETAERAAVAKAINDKIAASGVSAVSTADAGKPVLATVYNEAYSAPVFALAKPLVAKIATGAFVPVLAAGTPVPCTVTLPFSVAGTAAPSLALYEAQSATEFVPVATAALPAPAAAGAPVHVRVAIDGHYALTVAAAAAPALGKKPRATDFKVVASTTLTNELLAAAAGAAPAAAAGAVETAPFAAQQTAAAQVLGICQQWGKWKAGNASAVTEAYLRDAVSAADAAVKSAMVSALAKDAAQLPPASALNTSFAEVQEAIAAVLVLKKKGPEAAAAEAAAARRAAAALASDDDDDDEEDEEEETPEGNDDDADDDDDDDDFDMGGGDLD